MTGHGCPKNLAKKTPTHRLRVVLAACALLITALNFSVWSDTSVARAQFEQGNSPFASEPTRQSAPYRYRISWGGGQNQAWQGSLSTKTGTFSNVAPLGLSQDSSITALQSNAQSIAIQQRSPTSYDGFDFSISGSDQTSINIQLTAMDGSGAQWQKSISIAELLDADLNEALDELGHGISIARVPGDSIQADFKRDHLVFSPSEPISVAVAGRRMSLRSSQSSCRMKVVKARQSGPPLWTANQPLKIDAQGNSPQSVFEFNAPDSEGAYDLIIQMEKNWLSGSITANSKAVRPLAGKKSLVVRRVQFVVLSPKKPNQPIRQPAAKQLVQTLTPEQLLAAPSRWAIGKTEPQLLSSDPAAIVRKGGQSWVELQPGQWQAIAFQIAEPGKGHTIELDFDNSGPIAAGLSILDFDANGQVPINGADSGIFVPESLVHQFEDQAETNRPETNGKDFSKSIVGKHSLKFWPRSKTCYLLVANQSEKHAARIATLRVLSGADSAKRETKFPNHEAEDALAKTRQRLAFYTSANFAEGLNVEKFFDARVNQPLDDWDVFYQGALRLVDYLKESNYQGAIIPVVIDGATLYPSQLFRGSPKSDSGTFQSLGQDPVRKDVLRMLLTIFERENLTLIPAFEFSGPVARIETQRNLSENDIDILDLSAELVTEGLEDFPYYNPLSQTVQQHALDVISEAVRRYSDYSSLGGVSLLCRPNSWTILPGRQYGYDRKTIGRFLDSLPLPPESLKSHQDLIEHVTGDFREQWIQWRSDQMSDFYMALSNVVTNVLPEGRLLIAPINLHKNAEIASQLSPNLHSSVDVAPLLQRLGLDPRRLEESDSIVLLNPQSIPSTTSLPRGRIGRQTNELADFHSFFNSERIETGTLFYQEGTWAHFAQLQMQPPFDNQIGRLIRRQHLTPSGIFTRQPMARALHRLDSALLIDASDSLSMVPSNTTESFTHVFSKLPRKKFSEVPLRVEASTDSAIDGSAGPHGSCPIAVRTLKTKDRTYLYCVNDSPWPTVVNIHLDFINQAPKMLLASSANAGRNSTLDQRPERTFLPFTDDLPWSPLPEHGGDRGIAIELPAYQVWGGTFATNAVGVSHFDIKLPNSGERIHGALRKKIYQLQAKLNLATSADSIDVLTNQDFEIKGQGSLDGWQWDDQANEQIHLEPQEGYNSAASLRMKTDGQSVWMRSNRFAPPETGRLSVTVWIKSIGTEQPPLRLAIEGQTRSSTYYRFGAIGALAPDSGVNQIDNQWRRFAVHFDDLPTEELIDLRMGFDLMGAGEVLIDNVRVYDRWLDDKDTTAMTQLLASAVELLSRPDGFESCRRIVEGHWARFLDEYTQLAPTTDSIEDTSNIDQRAAGRGLGNEIYQDFAPVSDDSPLDQQPTSSSPRRRENGQQGTSLLRRWRNSLKPRK